MTCDEIREQPIIREDGLYCPYCQRGGDSSDPAIAFFLREIAAQLADLNQTLRKLTALDGQVLDVRVSQ